MDGIVIVDKPAGWTSQDVTARLRRVFGTRRIGHGGTLDPLATGVLPVFVGRATRAVEFFESAEKRYVATLLLGRATDTQDISGATLRACEPHVSLPELEAVLPRFTGQIEQTPPMYSALKVHGQKLCDLARRGQEVAREKRAITVFSLEVLRFAPPRAELRVHCSKGTYIRTLCADIGESLGCGGCMETLRRTSAGRFSIEQAVALSDLLSAESPADYLLPVDTLFAELPAVTLTPRQEARCRNGNAFSLPLDDGRYRVYARSGEFLMLGRAENGVMSTVKSFFAAP